MGHQIGPGGRQGLAALWGNVFKFCNEAIAAGGSPLRPWVVSLLGGVNKDLFPQSLEENPSCSSEGLQFPATGIFRSPLQQLWANVRLYGSVTGENGRQSRLSAAHRGPLSSSSLGNPFVIGGVRFKQNKSAQAMKRSAKKKKSKLVRNKLRQIKLEKKTRKASMSPEETLVWRIEKLKKKIALHEQQLQKYALPEFPEPDPDPEILTPEQLYALKKLGYKNKNYVPVGRRGIYGGTIQNMHMHWKKHETVRIDCNNFAKEKLKAMGEQLERLSRGTVIDIHQAKTIIMWRGRNYKRPKVDIPEVFKNFNKRKALLKSKHDQAIASLTDNIKRWEKDLREVRADMAREAAERARWAEENPGLAQPEPAPKAALQEEEIDLEADEISDMSGSDFEINSVEDLGPEIDSDFEDSDEFSDEPPKNHCDEDSDEDDVDSDEYRSDVDIEDDSEVDRDSRSKPQRSSASMYLKDSHSRGQHQGSKQ